MTQQSFQSFLLQYQDRLRTLFQEVYTPEDATIRKVPEELLTEVLNEQPLSVFIPEQYGGRGQHVAESLAMLEASSYESLALSLTMGINGALFLQPLSKYGDPQLQQRIFHSFLHDNALGGLMITEPDFGSEALSMRTSFRSTPEGYLIRGMKHWGGLTGRADYWLLTARGDTGRGTPEEPDLERAISFFLWEQEFGGIEVQEYYRNLGLYMIPYGLNKVDTVIPDTNRLATKAGGVRMLLDLLHRSRLQFPGMAMGFLRRLRDETVHHVQNRFIGGKALFTYDQVQDRIAVIQAYCTTCAAMCAHTSAVAGVDSDCSPRALEANVIKTVITDMMQGAAQSALQLFGGMGYRMDSIVGRAVVDSRPFQIFEGSNDILYQQITEAVLKSMAKVKEFNLTAFLRGFHLSSRAIGYIKDSTNFSIDLSLSQRKMVELGRILGRIMSLNMVLTLQDNGYVKEHIDSAVAVLRRQIAGLLATFTDNGDITLSESSLLKVTNTAGAWMTNIAPSV